MIEEIYYLDEAQVKVTAATVGISYRRWTCIEASDITDDNYKKTMKDYRFDTLPIVDGEKMIEYFGTEVPNNYEKISRKKITHQDVLPLDTNIHEVIKGFATDKRTFYFLTFQNRITGLITLSNLNCRQVQIYIFGQICDLERSLSEFIDINKSNKEIEDFVKLKSKSNEKYEDIWSGYQIQVQNNTENKLIEQLYLVDLFCIIKHFSLYTKLDYTKKEWNNLSSINELRKLVAHSVRNILDQKNDINKLWKRIGMIEELTFRLKQIKTV